jgi:hypothetical protein
MTRKLFVQSRNGVLEVSRPAEQQFEVQLAHRKRVLLFLRVKRSRSGLNLRSRLARFRQPGRISASTAFCEWRKRVL